MIITFEMLYSSNEMLCQETLAPQKSLDHFGFDLLSKPEKYQNRNKIKPRKGNIDCTFFQEKHQ